MELLALIRRWHYRDGLSIREIARRLHLSRNTVRKYLRSGVTEPKYPARQSPNRLDPFAERLRGWLKADAAKPKRERRTARSYFQVLQGLGYPGSYGRVSAFVRHWRREQGQVRAQVYIPLQFAPGEAFQFDWSEEWVPLGGRRVLLQVAHLKLCYSRAFLLVAYVSQAHEMLFDAHGRAFRIFGGVPTRGIYDNMKTAVDKVKPGKVREVNRRFAAMTAHYLFEPEFCNRAAGWEKGRVEKDVQDARRQLWQSCPAFGSLVELNAWLEARCQELWTEQRHPEWTDRTVAEVLAEERPHLMSEMAPFDGFLEQPARVSSTCLVHFQRNRYSVPAHCAHRVVSVRAYADRLIIVAEGQVVAEHARVFGREQTRYDWQHYLPVLERKPGALRNGAPFADLPLPFKRLQALLLQRPGGDREMVDVLARVPRHGVDAVQMAVEWALEANTPSREHVFNLLSRLESPQSPPPLVTALALTEEPKADVARYDTLRSLVPWTAVLSLLLPLWPEVAHVV